MVVAQHEIVIRPQMSGHVNIDGVVKKNMLLRGYFALVAGLVSDSAVDIVHTDGAAGTVDPGNAGPGAVSQFWVGNGTGAPYFGQHTLEQPTAVITPTWTYSDLTGTSPGTRITASAVLNRNISEIGIRYKNGSRFILLTRAVQTGISGQTATYNIDIMRPFLKNFAVLMYSKLTNSNNNVIDVAGSQRTVRGNGNSVAGKPRIVLSPDPLTAWDPNTVTLTNAIEAPLAYSPVYSTNDFVVAILTGSVVPSNNINVNTIGLVQKFVDPGGNQFDVLIMAETLPSPITLTANKHEFITIKLVFH